jgi:hypothetical protein
VALMKTFEQRQAWKDSIPRLNELPSVKDFEIRDRNGVLLNNPFEEVVDWVMSLPAGYCASRRKGTSELTGPSDTSAAVKTSHGIAAMRLGPSMAAIVIVLS